VLKVYDGLAEETGLNLVVAGTREREGETIRARLGEHARRGRVRVLPFYGEGEMRELAEVYAGASVYLDLSLHEGFGMQVIEAMACGTPVVCSNGGALPEVAGDAAAMVEPMDAAGARREVRRVVEDGTRREELTRRGREQARKYTWEGTARVIGDALDAL
jgi:glycosyltransferase involved in cell wall biosynthesis